MELPLVDDDHHVGLALAGLPGGAAVAPRQRPRSRSSTRRSTSRGSAGDDILRASAAAPRPLSRGKSRRSLKRYINDAFVSAPWAASYWSNLSDAELAHRLKHMLLQPPSSTSARGGFRPLFAPQHADVLNAFRRGAYGWDARSVASASAAAPLDARRLTAASMLARMYSRVPASLRPMLLRECRRAARLAVTDPELAHSFLADAEALCLGVLDGSLPARLRAGGAFVGGDAFAAVIAAPVALCVVAVPPNADTASSASTPSGAAASVEGLELVLCESYCATLLRGACCFYGLRFFSGLELPAACMAEEDRPHALCVRVALMPALSRAARVERAATALLCKQLAEAAEAAVALAAATAMTTAPSSESMAAGAEVAIAGALLPADAASEAEADAVPAGAAAAAVAAAAVARAPPPPPPAPASAPAFGSWGPMQPLLALHVRTVTDQTQARFSATAAVAAGGGPLPRGRGERFSYGRHFARPVQQDPGSVADSDQR